MGDALARAVRQVLTGNGGVLQGAVAASWAVSTKSGRCRNLFPLPLLSEWPRAISVPEGTQDGALPLANLCVVSLNMLWADFKVARIQPPRELPTEAQKETQHHVASRTARLLTRLAGKLQGKFLWRDAFSQFETATLRQYEPLRGDAVDLPDQAATCNPVLHVSSNLQEALCNPSAIFPDEVCHDKSVSADMGDGLETAEYVRLVAREIACGKLRLRREAKGIAPVFAAKKTTPGSQRKIWNGSQLSGMANQPPKPEFLANPSSFLDIHVEPSEPIWYSKRDAETFFDILQVPPDLQTWFGQTPVAAGDLCAAMGSSLDSLGSLVDDLGKQQLAAKDLLHPVHTVWPMGFSWSSAIAQSTTLSIVEAAGVGKRHVLSMDQPPPADQTELVLVATDDTVFAHRDIARGSQTLRQFDASMANASIPRKRSKDITLVENITALGCEISSRPHLAEPAADKLHKCFCSLLDVLAKGVASPRAVNGLLGLLQWFALLQRPYFATFNHVYEFVRREPAVQPTCLPLQVQQELAVAFGLLPLLAASLDKPCYPELMACDAAPEFGFGVCAAQCPVSVLQEVGRLAERRGDFVRLHSDNPEAELQRLGTPHRLSLPKHSFKSLISKRACWKAHSGVLEGHGLLLCLKWVARNARKHHKKVVVLIDAKAVLGAAAKGRTSAPALRGVIRAIGAYSLASDSLLRLVYVPSEDNPADAPSRGRRNTVRRRQTKL